MNLFHLLSSMTSIYKKPPSFPVIAIIGASGVGKSKLAINLALSLNGECINADAMQIYKGLDISTNKVTMQEREQCPHHLLGVHDLIESTVKYTVHDFQTQTIPLIKFLIERNRVPILVGGTMYYVESVLFDHLVPERNKAGNFERKDSRGKSTEELLAELEKVDPKIAYGIHPNDRRKIIRALEVYQSTGKQLSSFYAEQHASVTNNAKSVEMLSGKPRYDNSLMIWLDCEQTVLDVRLDNRIDEMIRDGLIAELDDFFLKFKSSYPELFVDEESMHNGILQSIGLKEFFPYLQLDKDQRESTEGQKIYANCVEAMKTKTRRYARKQLTWIKNRFLKRRISDLCPPVFRLDVTSFVDAANNDSKEKLVSSWDKVISSAMAISENSIARGVNDESFSFLSKSCSIQPEQLIRESESKTDPVIRNQCLTCRGSPVFVRESQWIQHMKGWRHIKTQRSLKNKSPVGYISENS